MGNETERTHRIGIVDDDVALLGLLKIMHEEMFVEPNVVSQVYRVADAPTLLEHDPDVILVDGRIDDDHRDGLAVMRVLRERGYMGPFITISHDAESRRRMLEAGCAAGCEKDDIDLPEVVQRVVAEYSRGCWIMVARASSSDGGRHTSTELHAGVNRPSLGHAAAALAGLMASDRTLTKAARDALARAVGELRTSLESSDAAPFPGYEETIQRPRPEETSGVAGLWGHAPGADRVGLAWRRIERFATASVSSASVLADSRSAIIIEASAGADGLSQLISDLDTESKRDMAVPLADLKRALGNPQGEDSGASETVRTAELEVGGRTVSITAYWEAPKPSA